MVVLPSTVPAAVGGIDLTRTLPARMVQAMNLPSWIIVALCLLTQATPSWSADDAVKEKQRRFLITGMRAEREKLRSGHAILTGDHWSHTPVLGRQRLSVRFDVYFDHDSRSYRYTQQDYEQYATAGMDPKMKARLLARSDLPHGITPEGVEWVSTDNGGTVVHTPEYDLHNPPHHPHVTRQAPGTLDGTSVREWDLAAVGLLDWPSFEGGLRIGNILDAYETRVKCHSVEIDPSGLSRLKLRSEWTETEIWIDEKQGMTPVRITRKDLNDSLKETSQSDVGWKEINGVMVPVSFRINYLYQPEITEGYDLTLEWSHVNEPLDPQVFTPAGITESKSALVADMRLGQIVVERVNPLPLPVPVAGATPKSIQPKPPSRLGWIVLGHLIVGGGFAWWYYRRRAKRQAA